MSFYDDQASAEANQPREFYVIEVGDPAVTTYRVASGNRDLVVNIDGMTSVVHEAIAVARTDVGVPSSGQSKDLTLTLPVDHALVKRYLLQGVPPKVVNVRVYELQVVSGEFEQIWVGKVTSMSVEGEVAKFRIPSRMTETMLRVLPTITAGKQCPHILYDDLCQVSRTGSHAGLAHKVTTTVIYVNGRDVRVDLGSTSRNGTWSENGEVYHQATGERMTVRSQTDLNPGVSAVADLSMQSQIPELKVGDTVEIYAGCTKLIGVCHARFGNRYHFGGFNRMPSKNVFKLEDRAWDSTFTGEV